MKIPTDEEVDDLVEATEQRLHRPRARATLSRTVDKSASRIENRSRERCMGRLGASPPGSGGGSHRGIEGDFSVPEVLCRHREGGGEGRAIAGPHVARDRRRTWKIAPGDMAAGGLSGRRIEGCGVAGPGPAPRRLVGNVCRGSSQNWNVASVSGPADGCQLLAGWSQRWRRIWIAGLPVVGAGIDPVTSRELACCDRRASRSCSL
jgi:hypothetical protein